MAQLLVEYPPLRNAWSDNPLARGADGVLRYGNLNPALTELLDVQVHAFSGREAVVEIGGPRLTYRQLWQSASRIAGGLQEHGIGYGDRVAVRMPVGARWIQAFLGALLSGAVPVLVHDGLPDDVAARVISDSRADFVLDDAAGELPDGAAFIDDGASLAELALLCYTDGPMGYPNGAAAAGCSNGPRGVELTNENLLSAVRSMVGAFDLPTEGVRNLVLLPLAHASGCVDQLLPTFAVGGTVVLAPDPARVADAIVTERIDMVAATPRIFAGLLPDLVGLRADGVRQLCSAGGRSASRSAEPHTEQVVATALREVFPLARQWSVWGATETSGIGLAVTSSGTAVEPDGRDLLGFAFGGTELALWGPSADAGHGELLCRGPNVTQRYWDDPAATESRFTGPWFHTGHQVAIDADGLVRRAAVPAVE